MVQPLKYTTKGCYSWDQQDPLCNKEMTGFIFVHLLWYIQSVQSVFNKQYGNPNEEHIIF